jgi:hypothetical protein
VQLIPQYVVKGPVSLDFHSESDQILGTCYQLTEKHMQLVQSISEVAHPLRLGRTSIYAPLNRGRLETVKVGSRTLVKTSSTFARVGASEVVT